MKPEGLVHVPSYSSSYRSTNPVGFRMIGASIAYTVHTRASPIRFRIIGASIVYTVHRVYYVCLSKQSNMNTSTRTK